MTKFTIEYDTLYTKKKIDLLKIKNNGIKIGSAEIYGKLEAK